MGSHVDITANEPGRAAILLDGTDISGVVSGVNLVMDVGELPSLRLVMAPRTITLDVDGEIKVIVDPRMRAALEAAGWTAP